VSKRSKAALAVLAVVASLGVAVGVGPASATPYYGDFQNASSELCLAIPDDSIANGTEAIQWECGSNPDQMWKEEFFNSTQFRIRNENSQLCLGVGGSSTAPGAHVIQWPCDGAVDQVWELDSTGRLWNSHSRLCLAVPNASPTHGVKLIQWTCADVHTNPEQKWV